MYPQRSVMTCGLATALEPPHFNHAPVRGAIGAIQYVAGYVTKFQSTHPRGVRQALRRQVFGPEKVSIHAPAWGATLLARVQHQGHCGFNPRTRVGCDWSVARPWACGAGFNPRTRVGCDLETLQREGFAEVSIHAPAWGATAAAVTMMRPSAFQSTHPRGVRQGPFCGQGRAVVFQSTHPRGVRHREKRQLPASTGVSIHAPAWGATNAYDSPFRAMKCFNPRTRVGCDYFSTVL